MEFVDLEQIKALLPQVAIKHQSVYDLMPFVIACITFWVITHLVFELLLQRWNKTWQGKPRDGQIEYREYCCSLVHAFIVCPASYYGMFVVW